MRLVAEIEGVSYYDDSGSTTIEAAVETIRSIIGDKVIILGGSAKAESFDELARVIEDNNVIHALLIGEASIQMARALERVSFNHFTIIEEHDMQKLIDTAYHLTEPSDALLFIPACEVSNLFFDPSPLFEAAVLQLVERVNGKK